MNSVGSGKGTMLGFCKHSKEPFKECLSFKKSWKSFIQILNDYRKANSRYK